MHLPLLQQHNAVDSRSACKSNLIFLCRSPLSPSLLPSVFVQLGSAVQVNNLLFASVELPLFFIPIPYFSRQYANPAASQHYKLYTLYIIGMYIIIQINIILNVHSSSQFWIQPVCALLAVLSGFAQHLTFLLFLPFTLKYPFFQNGACGMNWCLSRISSSTWLLQRHTDQ